MKCVVCGWAGPHIAGGIDERDAELVNPIHRQGVDARIAYMQTVGRKTQPKLEIAARKEYGAFYVPFDLPGRKSGLLAACFAYEAFVCGDDCSVDIAESVRRYKWDEMKKVWVLDSSAATHPVEGFNPGSTAGTTVKGVVLMSDLKMPSADGCDRMIVITDCPVRGAVIDPPRWIKAEVDNTTAVTDVRGESGLGPAQMWFTFSQFFSGPAKAPIAEITVKNVQSRRLGDPKDCC
jgi:hypothetical protein